jgi:hypothetical protein
LEVFCLPEISTVFHARSQGISLFKDELRSTINLKKLNGSPMDIHEWSCRIKSARRKRRLVKTDRDKQLIQLCKRRAALWEQRKNLPPVPLEQPYQRGWKRFFVLRDDIRRSPRAEFYGALLVKINTVEYHHDKSFKRRKRRKKRYVFSVKKQSLREFDLYQWNHPKLKLNEQEKDCFTRVETYSIKTRRTDVKYVFNEPWRYVLKVAPHIVTHKMALDIDIERELAWIAVHIDKHDLQPRIDLLVYGRGYNSHKCYDEPAKYINKLKNIPRYGQTEAYLELET